MRNLDERLKDAIACSDFEFLEKNRHLYDINHRFPDEGNDTLLLYSISDGGSDSYIFFLRNGADISLVNHEGEGIIHSVVYSGLVERLKSIMYTPFNAIQFINMQRKDGATPLLLSILLEKEDMSNYLIELGADINLPDETGNAPIHPACFQGQKEVVVRLVESGADLRVKTAYGNYPLALAVNGNHDEIVRYIFEKIYK
ncbi:ankyrin repeat domain-containing protein [uncultured Dysgonomonas sp.]|uniref:ankyrin repeat domain-containing protein n=1 Tax=uncultured Dysgonomonas sp. TaxID=206096 RepID=UPI0026138FF8|nr:ankyrin repeat domain-containing protein [uncultured Dysgonomonas sp.]